MTHYKLLLAGAAFGILAACGGEEAGETTAGTDVAAPEAEAPVSETSPVSAEPETVSEGTMAMEDILAADWRTDEDRARDAFRNPAETLAFFEVEPGDTVVEIWPGGGWYTKILGPYLKSGGGTLIAAGFDPERSDYAARGMQRFRDNFVEQADTYGDIEVTVFSADSDGMAAPGTADVVLTFRNVHNWMSGEYAEKAFADAFAALKPGGVLGVVEHRLPSSEAQDPVAASGYVHEDYVIALAEEAGFVLEERSEINANPADTADHPFGVWTLPPVSRTEDRDGNTPEDFDAAKYQAIGESDRMTLKFRKPE
jgi:predicted methyltransferase